MFTKKASVLAMALCLSFFAAGCKKKVGVPPPPRAPETAKAVVPMAKAKPMVKFFTAEPSTIERGQVSVLRYEVTGADSATIDNGIGQVGTGATITGSRNVFPSQTTSYTLTAMNEGGSVTETVTVSVTAPPVKPEIVAPKAPEETFSERVARGLKDVFFDFDKSDLREDSRSVLTANADTLKAIFQKFPTGVVTLEGHCDERGSAEYNLGLGDRRAIATKDFLVQLGVAADRVRTLSYGKERPQCTENTEDCWQKNRRTHFTAQ